MSHMEDPRELYVQEKKQLETLKDLQRNINKYCMENYCSLSEDELKEGEGVGRGCVCVWGGAEVCCVAGMQCGAMFNQDGVYVVFQGCSVELCLVRMVCMLCCRDAVWSYV